MLTIFVRVPLMITFWITYFKSNKKINKLNNEKQKLSVSIKEIKSKMKYFEDNKTINNDKTPSLWEQEIMKLTIAYKEITKQISIHNKKIKEIKEALNDM